MSNLVFGNPFGIKEGEIFESRAELIKAGLHRYTVHGIDGNGNDGASAIVLSGGYEDDVDLGDEIIYTGHGGNDTNTGKQIDDQSWESPGNKGLIISQRKQLPVRVIRSFKHNSVFSPKTGYKYGGLYKVVDHWDELGKSGFHICRFKLVKEDVLDKVTNYAIEEGCLILLEPTGKEPKWFSIGVDAPNAQKISSQSKMANLLINKHTGDNISFGNGFKILKVRKYLSK